MNSQPIIFDRPSKRELSISKRVSAGKTPSDTCRREISVSVRWERSDGATNTAGVCSSVLQKDTHSHSNLIEKAIDQPPRDQISTDLP